MLAAGVLTAASALACANPGAPPGGPVDITAPRLLRIAPDSGREAVTPREVVFRFDEVVSERPAAVTSLARLFLISPENGTPVVDWNRSEVSVRPRRGWRPNTIYTVTLLPGITDLRGNASTVGGVTVFSTGGPIPETRVRGRAFDWAAGRPAPGAIVQAITPDSVVYVTVADSAGLFTLSHLPPGQYTLQAVIDMNRSGSLDPGEPFDTLGVHLVDTLTVQLAAFVRDSVAPRLSGVTARDSLTLLAAFDLPLDPAQEFAASQFTVVGPDSLPIAVLNAVPEVADTVAIPLPRPIPPRVVRLELAAPLTPGTAYRVSARGLRGLAGFAGESERLLRTAERPDQPARPEQPEP